LTGVGASGIGALTGLSCQAAAAAAAATEVQARQPRCAGKRHSHWRVLLDLKALVPLALRASSFFINCVWPESFSLRFRVCRVKKYCVKRVLGWCLSCLVFFHFRKKTVSYIFFYMFLFI